MLNLAQSNRCDLVFTDRIESLVRQSAMLPLKSTRVHLASDSFAVEDEHRLENMDFVVGQLECRI